MWVSARKVTLGFLKRNKFLNGVYSSVRQIAFDRNVFEIFCVALFFERKKFWTLVGLLFWFVFEWNKSFLLELSKMFSVTDDKPE